MKTFALADGDLVVGPRGYAIITGAQKLRQDLGVAIREPVGGDRFHPGWGSALADLVGSQVDAASAMKVRVEVARVLSNYVAAQQAVRRRDAAVGRTSRFSAGEIIRKIADISIVQTLDTLRVRVVVDTVSDNSVVLNTQVAI